MCGGVVPVIVLGQLGRLFLCAMKGERATGWEKRGRRKDCGGNKVVTEIQISEKTRKKKNTFLGASRGSRRWRERLVKSLKAIL